MLGDMNLVTTIIGFGMSSTFIVFVCTRLICGRLREGESRHTLDGGLEIDLEQVEQRTNGLEPVMVAAIPTMKFHRDAFSAMEDAQKQSTCPVCRLPLKESLCGKRTRLVSFTVSLSDEDDEILIDHLGQSVPPSSRHPAGDGSGQQQHPQLTTRSPEPSLAVESQTG
ncbi:hypothetical protein Cgig2_026355 [Carnegiea gigantea]|uniref:Uncharacterized protein n=1 Tax=Carnegiea gigantea TaxID=171969 RepID=A0A9Q1QH22_9CARY|nr:hypothetical protein Cgig2_026355 [Carnegiea gigantea]